MFEQFELVGSVGFRVQQVLIPAFADRRQVVAGRHQQSQVPPARTSGLQFQADVREKLAIRPRLPLHVFTLEYHFETNHRVGSLGLDRTQARGRNFLELLVTRCKYKVVFILERNSVFLQLLVFFHYLQSFQSYFWSMFTSESCFL